MLRLKDCDVPEQALVDDKHIMKEGVGMAPRTECG